MKVEMKARPAAPKKPTIKILLYTDDPQIAPTDDFGQLFGLGSMIERLQAHKPTFANIEIKWASRNSDAYHHANNKLDDLLNMEVAETNEPFDEIWFFGLHQSNTNRFSLLARRGGPESELNENEIAALTEWMKVRDDECGGGGVLMTGDHSNETPPNILVTSNGHYAETSTTAEYLGLGRALGRCVPRAGSLRKWEGPPTYHAIDSFSTISESGFQTDRVPQQLLLRTVDADGDPDPNGKPHPLFYYRNGQFIEVFPDHAHEGAVVTPGETDVLDPEVWPLGESGEQTRPHVVALGRDPRKTDPLNLIATYNGDLSGVGRIVADSTWHHYMNLNLKGFPQPSLLGSASDQIGQFYANLAVWLAPRCKREEMAQLMLWELARYTLLLEEQEDADSTGATAQAVLATIASDCEVHELIQAYTPRELTDLYARNDKIHLPSRQELVGAVVKSYQKALILADTAIDAKPIEVEKVIRNGLDSAFEHHVRRVEKTLAVFDRRPKPGGDTGPTGPSQTYQTTQGGPTIVTTTCAEPNEEWTIETETDAKLGKPSVTNTLVFCLDIGEEAISGQVADAITGDFLSEVTGTYMSLAPMELDPDAAFVTLNYYIGATRVALSGVMFGTHFEGRFTTFVAAAPAVSAASPSRLDVLLAPSPGDGDTGSASGTQT